MTTADQLAVLLADPTRAESISRSDLPDLLGEVERLRAILWAQLVRPPEPNEQRPKSSAAREDRLLKVDEAAERLGVNRGWIYQRADTLPFTRRIGVRTLRFSEQGLERWLETRK